MIRLAMREEQLPVPLGEIAAEEDISPDYLEQLVISLRKAGLLRTTRGPRGGIQLTRPAGEITVRQVVEALEGPVELRRCVADAGSCERSGSCAARELWEELARVIASTLESATLADLCRRQRELSESRNASYAI